MKIYILANRFVSLPREKFIIATSRKFRQNLQRTSAIGATCAVVAAENKRSSEGFVVFVIGGVGGGVGAETAGNAYLCVSRQ